MKMKIKDWNRSLKVRLVGEFFMNTSYWMVFPFLAMSIRDMLQVEGLIRVCQEFLRLSPKAVVILENQCYIFLT